MSYVHKKGASKDQLIEDDQTVWLIVATKEFSDVTKAKPHRMYVSGLTTAVEQESATDRDGAQHQRNRVHRYYGRFAL